MTHSVSSYSYGKPLLFCLLTLLLGCFFSPGELVSTLEEQGNVYPQASLFAEQIDTYAERLGLHSFTNDQKRLLIALTPTAMWGRVARDTPFPVPTSSANSEEVEATAGIPVTNASSVADVLVQSNETVAQGVRIPPQKDVTAANGTGAVFRIGGNATQPLDLPGATGDERQPGKATMPERAQASWHDPVFCSALENALAVSPGSAAGMRPAARPGLATRNATIVPVANGTLTTVLPRLLPPKEGKTVVLLTGDSMMMEGLGPYLLKELRQRGDEYVHREAVYSTG